MKIIRAISLLALLVGLAARSGFAIAGGVTPSYVNVKVYEIRLSQSANCTNGITVYQNAAPSYQNWTSNPTIGSGAVPNGTYQCIMFKMSDYIHFTPSTTDVSWVNNACVVSTDYELDVAHDEIGVNPDGTTQNFGAAGVEQLAWLYVRTGGGTLNGNAWSPADGLSLTSPLVVNGNGTHTIVFDFTDQVSEVFNGSTWECGCEAPTMSFR